MVICLLLVLGVWIVFGQTLHHKFVNFDDDRLIYENSAITQGLSLKGVVWAFTHTNAQEWYPLTAISHMLDWQLYGRNPGGHHFTNVLLHAITVVLLFLVLRRMTGAFWPSAFVAAVFAVHPLRVESVAWVSERKDVLSGLFFVLTLGAYARYVRRSEIPMLKADGRVWTSNLRPLVSMDYWFMALLFALGLVSKTMLVTLPFVLLLLDYWPLNRLKLSSSGSSLSTVKRLVWEKIPLVLLSAASCVATLVAQRKEIVLVESLGLFSRIGNALEAYVVYIRQMVYPIGLAVLYPHPRTRPSVWTVGLCGVALSLVTVGVVRWRRKNPYLMVGWFWYLGTLVPVIGLVQVGSQAWADRYTYLPQIGLYIMVAWGAVNLCGHWRGRRVVLPSTATVILTGLLVMSRAQTQYWRDSVSLWTHTLACTSGNYTAYNDLASALADQGKWHQAIPYCERALQIKPDYVLAQQNLGLALGQEGKWSEAISHFERALQLQPGNAKTQYGWGYVLARQRKWNEAIRHFERALQLNPDYADAHNALGFALSQEGKWDDAIAHYERALQLQPAYAQAQYNLGFALGQQGMWNDAIPHYERALKLRPDYAEAQNALGFALGQQGMWNDAIPHYERALQLQPAYAQAEYNLGFALGQERHWEEAIQHFERAVQLNPDYADAHNALGVALGRQGKWSEAIQHFEHAIQIGPDFAEVEANLGNALAAQGKWSEAIRHFQQALKLATAQANPAFLEAIREHLKTCQSNLLPMPQRGIDR